MKRIIITIFLIGSVVLLFSVEKYEFPKKDGKIFFTEVVEVPDVEQSILHSRALEWFAKAFKSAQDVIQMNDKENGKIVGKGNFGDININVNLGLVPVEGHVNFTISIYFKEGKYKFEITDFYHEGLGRYSNGIRDVNGGSLDSEKPECGIAMPKKKWQSIKDQTYERVIQTIEGLKKAMTIDVKTEDW